MRYIERTNNGNYFWTTQDKRKILLTEMGLSHLASCIDMLARSQLQTYREDIQEDLEILMNELGRRRLKRLSKDLF